MVSRAGWTALGAVLVLGIGACSSGASPSPSAPPVASASAPAPSGSAVESASPAPSSSVIATIPDDQLTTAGRLTICSDIPYPPQEFFDDAGNPTGSDIDLGSEIATRLGLTMAVNNTVFDTIIAALQGGKCDIIISAQNITSDRIKQVDMIPYFQAGQSFVVAKGNPSAINATTDLCGKTVATETETTEAHYIEGTGDYKGAGLTQACTKAGSPAITLKQYQKDSDALLALQAGQVDTYFADSPVAGYYTVQHADQFELSPIPPLEPALEGISVPNDDGHKALRDGVQQALLAMIQDGAYTTILTKYGVESGAVTADDASAMNKIK